MKQIIYSLLQISLLTLGYLYTTTKPTLAQVTPDNTVNTQVERSGNVSEITGGATRGDNLFHSFEQFSVPNGNEAFFNNVNTIQNIFSRVTGGSISEINGLIRANGSANLFLINPAGIIFGENASLKLGGSFYGSTASSIIFPDGEFSAIAPKDSILTISVPIGLSFEDNPEPIVNRSVAGLEVAVGEDIFLVGGNIDFPGGKIFAPGGDVELGGLAAAGEIEIDANGNLIFPDAIERGDVTLSNAAEVDVRSGGGGNVTINASNLNLLGGEPGRSIIRAGIKDDTGSTETQAGDITLDITNTINVSQESSIANQVTETGVGNAGKIKITTTDLNLTEGSIIIASTFGQGDAGAIEINAFETILIEETSAILSLVNEDAVGNSGGIEITTNNLSLNQGSQVSANIFGEGNAGAIKINALGSISLFGERQDVPPTIITSQVGKDAVGNSGGIQLSTNNLSLNQGSQVSANTFGEGNTGAIRIDADEMISISGETQGGLPSAILSRVEKGAGNSGGIEITTNNLSLNQGGQVNADTVGWGDAGAIKINADEMILISGETQGGLPSAIASNIGEGAVGNSEGIEITTNNLSLNQGGRISADIFGKGNAGAIKINADEMILISGETQGGLPSAIGSNIGEGAGNSEGIEITTNNLSLNQGGRVSASTFGQGDAGAIKIDASDTILISGEAQDSTLSSGIVSSIEEEAIGTSRGIEISTNNLFLARGGRIAANTFGQGDAGAIKIDASDTISISGETQRGLPSVVNSQVVGEGTIGTSRGIEITTNNLSLDRGGRVNASTSGRGNAGAIKIDASDTISISGKTRDGNSSVIASQVDTPAVGDSKGIEISTSNLFLAKGGIVNASTFGRGNAGTIEINASDSISIEGGNNSISGIGSVSGERERPGLDNAGSIIIHTNNLILTNNAEISVRSYGQGNAGRLYITADSLTLNSSSLKVSAFPLSNSETMAGNITLQIDDRLTLNNNSTISARAFEDANGGNVFIDAELIFASPNQNNDIIASADRGTGGNINITSEGIFGLEERPSFPNNNTNDLDASSQSGEIDGRVQINAPDVNLQKELKQLEGELIATEATIANSCLTRSNQQGSFTISDDAGLSKSPDSHYSDVNFSLTGIGSLLNQPRPTQSNSWRPIAIPAAKMVATEDGRVFLVAAPQKAESLFCQVDR